MEELTQQDTNWSVFMETIQVGRGEQVLPHIDHKRELTILLTHNIIIIIYHSFVTYR